VQLVTLADGTVARRRGDEVIPVLADAANPQWTMVGLIEALAAGRVGDLAGLPTGPPRPFDPAGLAAPIPLPGAVIAAPVNYVDHKNEMSSATDIRSLGVFLKARSSVTGPHSTVVLPYTDRRFDQEGELGVVIGRVTKDVPVEAALECVFGYTCLLDITMRGGEDRSTRKSFRTFCPIGPWITTADEIADPGALTLSCSVSGVERQKALTSDLIWSIPELIAYTSSVMTLYPGDVIASGTPEGVGPLNGGDTIEVSIEGIGTLAVSVSDEGATACPTLGANSGPVPPPPPEQR
jgi:2-keto-4-pentenoate hydratase/2-oxohepta-3-ene-1,7-dioic acid hydratase in catechol pathway